MQATPTPQDSDPCFVNTSECLKPELDFRPLSCVPFPDSPDFRQSEIGTLCPNLTLFTVRDLAKILETLAQVILYKKL